MSSKPAQTTVIDKDHAAMLDFYSPEKSFVQQEPPQEEIDMGDASGPDDHVSIEMAKAESITSTEKERRAYRRCNLCTKICMLVTLVGMLVFFMCFPVIFKKKQDQVQYLTEDDRAVLPNIPGKSDK